MPFQGARCRSGGVKTTWGCLCTEMPPCCAERGFRKSPDGLGLGHGPRIAGADPPLRAVDGSDPALWDARCGIGAVRHVQAHAALPAGSLPYQRSLREGGFADEELDGRRHRCRHRNGGRARARTAVPRRRRQPLSRPDRLQRSGHPRRHPPLVLRRARRRGHPRGRARPPRSGGSGCNPSSGSGAGASCPGGPPRRTTMRPRW